MIAQTLVPGSMLKQSTALSSSTILSNLDTTIDFSLTLLIPLQTLLAQVIFHTFYRYSAQERKSLR